MTISLAVSPAIYYLYATYVLNVLNHYLMIIDLIKDISINFIRHIMKVRPSSTTQSLHHVQRQP